MRKIHCQCEPRGSEPVTFHVMECGMKVSQTGQIFMVNWGPGKRMADSVPRAKFEELQSHARRPPNLCSKCVTAVRGHKADSIFPHFAVDVPLPKDTVAPPKPKIIMLPDAIQNLPESLDDWSLDHHIAFATWFNSLEYGATVGFDKVTPALTKAWDFHMKRMGGAPYVEGLEPGLSQRAGKPLRDPVTEIVGPLAQLIAHSLYRDLPGDNKTWADARDLYIWEREALNWLVRNRGDTGMSDWTATILDKGYPPKSVKGKDGIELKAGFLWRAPRS
jgi:hypothetical protein